MRPALALASLAIFLATAPSSSAHGGVMRYCQSSGARIEAAGSASFTANNGSGDLVLIATNLPTGGMLPVGSAAIPEIALMKRTNQQAVCKLSVFAYDRMSGQPVWQSGNRKIASRAKDSWFLGAGPFQKGTIYDGTAFAGEKLNSPFSRKKKSPVPPASVAEERRFPEERPQYAQGSSRIASP